MHVGVLAISGSLRAGSSNAAVLRAAQMVAPIGLEFDFYEELDGLPAFNPDLDEPGIQLPRAPSDLRARVAQAHALIICSPEYAHGIPGALKNLLDWLVGSEEFPGKPVLLVAASERSRFAQSQLGEVLRTMSARLVFAESVVVPVPSRTMDAAAIAADPRLGGVLRDALGALMQAIVLPAGATPGTDS